MTTVHVSASREYDVLIGRGLLDSLGEVVRAATKAQTAVVIAGDRVFPLYGARAAASLEKAGLPQERFQPMRPGLVWEA